MTSPKRSADGPRLPASDIERYEAASSGLGDAILEFADNCSRRSHEAQMDSNRTARHITWSVVAIAGIVAALILVVSLALIGASEDTHGAVESIAGAVFIGLWVRGLCRKVASGWVWPVDSRICDGPDTQRH